jgi:hypothetical protein
VNAQRISIKLFAAAGTKLSPADSVRLFHRFIQEKLLDEVMVDVADYSHLRGGPGVLLVCHAAHYGLDSDGGFGLTYARKRERDGDFPVRLEDAFRATVRAAKVIEEQSALRFSGNEWWLRLNDRLLAPNDERTLSSVKPAIAELCAKILGKGSPTLARESDPKKVFGVKISVGESIDLPTLAKRLG